MENGDLQEFDGNFNQYSYSRLQKKIDLQLQANKDEQEVQRITALIEQLRDDASENNDPRLGRTLKSKVSYLKHLQGWQIKAPFVEIRQPDIRLTKV